MTRRVVLGAITAGALVVGAGGAVLGIPSASTAPVMVYSGILRKGTGEPLPNVEKVLQLKLWPSATREGTELCDVGPIDITTDNLGRFSAPLDDCLDAVKYNNDIHIEVIVGAVSLGTAKLGAVPYAVEAAHAVSSDSASGAEEAYKAATVAVGALRVSNDCKFEGSYTDCACAADEIAISGGACASGCGNSGALVESTRILEKTNVWRMSCANTSGSRVKCGSELAVCMKVSQ
jgi:hypothetical protein